MSEQSEPIVFKKKGRRNFRKKNVNDDNDEEGEVQQDEVTNNAQNTEKKTVKTPKAAALLSFDHGDGEEEDAGEVFKVKKSKESRKLSKQRHKVKKAREEKQPVSQKEVEDDKLESLREELSNLGDGEEDEDEGGGSDNESGAPKQEFQNPVKPEVGMGIVAPTFPRTDKGQMFHIPDAAAIHAARKKREMARQLGGDFVPLDDTDKYSGRFEKVEKSRLIREDDNDHSDDEEGGPLGFGTRKSNTHPAYQRRLEVEQALAVESDEESHSDEGDDALRRFEEEQIRKGVSIPQAQEEENPAYTAYVLHKLQDSDVGLTHPQTPPTGVPIADQSIRTPAFHQPSYPPMALENVTMGMIREKINHRIMSLQDVNRSRRLETDKVVSQMESCDTSIVSLEQQMGDAERRYEFFQEMRGYVRDLLECLTEKVTVIEDLESRMHMLLKQRSERLIERRQQDVKDQAEEFAAAQSGKPAVAPIGMVELDEFGRDKSMYTDQAKQRRAVERDARRSRRRRQRENIKKDDNETKKYHEGLSTDDEEGSGDLLRFKTETDKIEEERKGIFEDVLEDFSSIDTIKTRFQLWKYGFPDTYKQAFIHLCLPKLFLPFVKIEMLHWNPLTKDCKDFEEMSWFENLMFYGFHDESYDPDDEDTKLIPRLAEKALLPKLTGLFEHVWDPLSLQQTILARNLVKRLVVDYPTVSADKKPTQELFNAVIAKIQKCINDDVYVPLYPKSLLEKKSLGAEAFVERQFWSCLKLLGNVLLWHGLVSTPKLQELGIDGLLNRYLLLALQHASNKPHENVAKCQAIVSILPKDWSKGLERTTLTCLGSFSRYLENLASSLKLKAEGTTTQEKKKVRSGIKKVISMLMQIHALDIAEKVKISSADV